MIIKHVLGLLSKVTSKQVVIRTNHSSVEWIHSDSPNGSFDLLDDGMMFYYDENDVYWIEDVNTVSFVRRTGSADVIEAAATYKKD